MITINKIMSCMDICKYDNFSGTDPPVIANMPSLVIKPKINKIIVVMEAYLICHFLKKTVRSIPMEHLERN